MNYSIKFSGQVLAGFSSDQVKVAMAERMKLAPEKVALLFSGKSVILKKALDESSAQKYYSFFRQLGADVSIDPALASTAAAAAPEPSAELSNEPSEEPSTAAISLTPMQATEAMTAQGQPLNPYRTPQAKTTRDAIVYCRGCGVQLVEGEAQCPSCGTYREPGKPRSKYVAALLAFFLGGLGAHRLYLGQWWGIFYFLFYLIMIPVAWIEALVFLFTPKARWQRKYGNVKGIHVAIIVVVGFFGGTALLGIIAAIALPAYQDYTTRAAVAAALSEAKPYQTQMEAFVARTNFVPSANLDMNLPQAVATPHIAALTVHEQGAIQLELADHPSLEGYTLVLTPNFEFTPARWHCDGGTLPNRFRPANCRLPEDSSAARTLGSRLVASVAGTESLSLPEGHWRQQSLPEAALAYVNEPDDIGVVVVKEAKVDFGGDTSLAEYTQMLKDYAFAGFQNADFQDVGEHGINGNAGWLFEFTAAANNVPLRGLVVAVEGDEHFYKVMTLTARARFERNRGAMLAIADSFETNH
ncbi:NINE protein [Halioxenophilus sp. WMMB6]|uniref:NINE protein n=1 Tax=Halioxenophilus sp. WMMB6 TaxID=3073815 RepID=UPI00295E47C1|nr:NINE protein [Halioxenophilus sp. WMMB6]